MPGRFDVVLHVPDKQRLFGLELVLLKDLMDFLPLVPDVEVGHVEVLAEARRRRLQGEIVAMHRAQQECAQLARPAELQELARVRQGADRILHLAKTVVEPLLQLGQRNVRHVPVVKDRERETELRAELFQAHLRPRRLRQHVIGGLPDRRQVVHQGARPVEDDVPNHAASVTGFPSPATQSAPDTEKWVGNSSGETASSSTRANPGEGECSPQPDARWRVQPSDSGPPNSDFAAVQPAARIHPAAPTTAAADPSTKGEPKSRPV